MATSAESPSVTDLVRQSLSKRRIDIRSTAFEAFLLLMLLASLAILVILLTDVLRSGVGLLAERGGDFIQGGLSSLAGRAGVWQGIVGSFLMMAFVVLVAFPVGIGAAVYLEEYASDNRIARFIDVNVRNLAGVPSVVYGLLGLFLFVEVLAPITGGRSIISGGLTLSLLVLPLVIITSAEALRAVPDSIREAGYGVGATRWEVVRSHVLPSAAPGILTGTILSLSRALGETAPLLLVGAVTGFLSTGSQTLMEKLQGEYVSLPTIIYAWAKEPDTDFRALTFAAIIVLLAVILLANLAAIILRNRYERKW
jgi:phosphate transport system permease protein